MIAPAYCRAGASAPWLRRLLAAGGVALLLFLTVAAASPALHHWLHADGADGASDNCAVVLFTSGITLAAAAVAVAAPRGLPREPRRAAAFELFLSPPRYLRQPERGPPTA